jgi:hypothetical protein
MSRRNVAIEFDGLLYWYLDRFDPAEDRCSFCREVIPDADVPLIIWRGRGSSTAMARLHVPCGRLLLAAGKIGGAA